MAIKTPSMAQLHKMARDRRLTLTHHYGAYHLDYIDGSGPLVSVFATINLKSEERLAKRILKGILEAI